MTTILDAARVAELRARANVHIAQCADHGEQSVAACWKAIADACRDLDPTAKAGPA